MAETRNDLWFQALQQLSPETRQSSIWTVSNESPKSILDDVLISTKSLRDVAIAKKWKYQRSNGKVIILRDIFEKLINFAWKCAAVLDVVSNADPVHFGLPWAAVRFLLQVSPYRLGDAPSNMAISWLPRTDAGITKSRRLLSLPN